MVQPIMKLNNASSVFKGVGFRVLDTFAVSKALLLLLHVLSLTVIVSYLSRLSLCDCRHHVSGGDAPQPQPGRGQRGGSDGQPECQRQPHGAHRCHAGQPERERQHHGTGRGQHHWQPLGQHRGQLLQQVRRVMTANPRTRNNIWSVGIHCLQVLL